MRLFAYFAASHDTLTAYALSMSPQAGDIRTPGATPEQLRNVLKHGREQEASTKFAFASFLFSHNLEVGIMSLCLGILAGVPTIFLLIYNGMILGSFTAMHHAAGIYADYWAWILPHAVSELSAIILCGGVGLMLGMAVLSPGELTRRKPATCRKRSRGGIDWRGRNARGGRGGRKLFAAKQFVERRAIRLRRRQAPCFGRFTSCTVRCVKELRDDNCNRRPMRYNASWRHAVR